jgi:6-pyruvoyltetrahydropterin/6-carboxytetrahydropterin synthase
MEWELECAFKFDAAHRLWNMGDDHPCGRLHGHTWNGIVRIVAKKLSSQSFVIDFSALKSLIKSFVEDRFDHKFINEEFEESPTCENLAQEIYQTLAHELQEMQAEVNNVADRIKVSSVTVEETRGNSVTYKE